MIATEDIQLYGTYTLAVKIGEGYYGDDGTFVFSLMSPAPADEGHDEYERRRRSSATVRVMPPLKKRHYGRDWADHEHPEYGSIQVSASSGTAMEARAISEVLIMAADLLDRLHEQDGVAKRLAEQQYLHDTREQRYREEWEAQEQKRSNIKEEIQWYVGQKFKLRRKGYRATVFGVIDRVNDHTIFTTSERGVPMTTAIDDLEELHIMYDGEKRYTKVYQRESN